MSTVHFQISGHRVVLVVPQFTQVLKGFKMIFIGWGFSQWENGSDEWANKSTLSFWKPNLWLFVDLFLKVGKWVLNCAAGDKLVARWFIDGIVSAHVLQIRCYRGYKIRLSSLEWGLKSMKKVPGCFVDRCKNWTRDLYGHSLDILLDLQNLNQPIRCRSRNKTYRCPVPLDRKETVPNLASDIFPVS